MKLMWMTLAIFPLIALCLGSMETWPYHSLNSKSAEHCSSECDLDYPCKSWIYNIETKACHLNEYVKTSRNEYSAIEGKITYVAGIKVGKKRLRRAVVDTEAAAAFHAARKAELLGDR
jgi:hypothetical protein